MESGSVFVEFLIGLVIFLGFILVTLAFLKESDVILYRMIEIEKSQEGQKR